MLTCTLFERSTYFFQETGLCIGMLLMFKLIVRLAMDWNGPTET